MGHSQRGLKQWKEKKKKEDASTSVCVRVWFRKGMHTQLSCRGGKCVASEAHSTEWLSYRAH
jgi:hypothetical protein